MKHKSEYLELIFDGVYLLSAFAIGLSLLLLPPHGVRWIWGVMAIPAIRFVALAIVISFACYLPVVLWVDKYPKLGMLMVPKTCAYLWIVMIGYWV